MSKYLRCDFALGNPGSLCVTRDIAYVNIENIWGKV